MVRIDRRRIDHAERPVVTVVATRYDDLGPRGRVDDAATVVLLQEARACFNRQLGHRRLMHGLRVMVAALRVEHARELRYPEPVEIATCVLALGRTSFVRGQVIRQAGLARSMPRR